MFKKITFFCLALILIALGLYMVLNDKNKESEPPNHHEKESPITDENKNFPDPDDDPFTAESYIDEVYALAQWQNKGISRDCRRINI